MILSAGRLKLHHQKTCKSIGSTQKALERAGYSVRNRLRDSKSKIVDIEYVIYETSYPLATGQPCKDESNTVCPDIENLDMNDASLKKQSQFNKRKILIHQVRKN